jgi:glyoxylase-like metal-dependent hydrolase (beta-lactamase superfamily II)/rhodanese-related sulfurtransferase
MPQASVTPIGLHASLQNGERPMLLDVRNTDEFGRWRIEGPLPLDALNVPYFEFIEREDEAVGRVRTWLAGRGDPLVAVCAKGDSSAFVVECLREHGIAATNLAGGMGAWGLATAIQPLPAPDGVRVWQCQRFGRGCLSYVVEAGGSAVVIDPHRAIDEYHRLLDAERLTLRAVLDTHLHADHVSGARALASTAGVPYLASHRDFAEAAFPVEPVRDDERIRVGGIEVVPVVPLHTPGHTPGSTAFLVNDALLMTGDTVFVEGVGRPDLGGQTAAWARELYRTLRHRLAPLGPDLTVLPAHSSGPRERRSDGAVAGRLGSALATSEALQVEEAAFVHRTEAQTTAAPPAYATIRAINLGRTTVGEETLAELELGKNECALGRH